MTDHNDDKALMVAVDDGYAQIKIYGDQAPDSATRVDSRGRTEFVMKSAIAIGRKGLGSIDGNETIDSWETEEGNKFTVSDSIQTENTQFDSFHFSEIDRVLINQGLYSAGYGGRKVHLVAGLPVANFFRSGMRDEDQIQKKRANLLKKAKLESAGLAADIVDVTIGCQAVAAYVDWHLDDDLKVVNDADSRIAIVDIGGRTTDIAVVIGGNQIDHDHSGTANTGVLDVYAAIERKIHARFRIDQKLPLAVMEVALRERKVKLFGQTEDISEIVAAAISEQEQKIAIECERQLGAGATLDAVVFVGGGSALFTSLPGNFRNGILTPDPEISNARGMWKFYKWKQQQMAQAAE